MVQLFTMSHQFYKLRDWIPLNKLEWNRLSVNPNAIHLLEQNMDKIYWHCLSKNPNAIHLLEQNIDKIDCSCLSINPNAIHLLETNLDKINLYGLAQNPNAIHILQNIHNFRFWNVLSANPAIFEYDYEAMKKRIGLYKEELVAKQFHPKNMSKFIGWGFEEFDDLEF